MDRRWDDPPPGVMSGGGYHSAPYGNHAAHQSRFDGRGGGGGGGGRGAYNRDFNSPGPSRNQGGGGGGGFHNNNHNNRPRNNPQHQQLQQQQQNPRYLGNQQQQQHNHGPHNSRRGGNGGGNEPGGFAQHNSRPNRGGFGRGAYRNRSAGSGGRRSDSYGSSYESVASSNGAGPNHSNNQRYQHNNNRFQRDRHGGSQSDLRPASAASAHRGAAAFGADPDDGHQQRHQARQLPHESPVARDADDRMPSPPPAPRLSDNFADDDEYQMVGGSGNSFNKRIVFHDDDDPFTADDDDLIHSILNENAAEHFEAEGLTDITPNNPLVDLTVADELLQTICSSMDMPLTDEAVVGGVLAEVAAARRVAANPLTGAADPLLSAATAEPSTPGPKVAGSSTRSTASKSSQQGGDQQVTKKLINQLTRMDKHDLKQMINNPDSKYATALQTQARRKNREETRKQLRIISSKDAANSSSTPDVEPDECIDSSAIPADIFEQIGRALNVDLSMSFGGGDGGVGDDSARAESDFLMKRLAEAESEWTSGGDGGAAAVGVADGFQVLSEVLSTSDCDDGGVGEQQQRVVEALLKSPPMKRVKTGGSTTPKSGSKSAKASASRVENETFVKPTNSKTKANSSALSVENASSTSNNDSAKETSFGSTSSASTGRTPQFVVNPAAVSKKPHAILLTVDAPPVQLPAKPQRNKPSQSVRALQMWKIPNCYKDFILSKKMSRRFVQSAVNSNEEDQFRILSYIPKLMFYKLVLGEYKNIPAIIVEQFRCSAEKMGRPCDDIKWPIKSEHYAQVFARRLQKQGLMVSGMKKYLEADPDKKKLSKSQKKKKIAKENKMMQDARRAAKEAMKRTILGNASTSDEPQTPAERYGVSSHEDLNGFSTDQDTPLNRQRTLSITSTISTQATVAPKHIRFDGTAASADQDQETTGAEQLQPESPAAVLQIEPVEPVGAAPNQTAEHSSVVETPSPPTAKHIRFDAPIETEAPDPVPTATEDPQTQATTAAEDAVVIPLASESVVATDTAPSEPIDSVQPDHSTDETSSQPDVTEPAAVIEMPLPIVVAKPAAEFVECDDGRLAQRLCTSSAELMRHVPKHIRTAISKRLRELNEGELQAAARLRRSTSAALELEEDVIDVTPETPSVDLTTQDDADDSAAKDVSEKENSTDAAPTTTTLDNVSGAQTAGAEVTPNLASEMSVAPSSNLSVVSDAENTTTECATTTSPPTPIVPDDPIVTTATTAPPKATIPIPIAQPTVDCPPPPVPPPIAKANTSNLVRNPVATNTKSKTKVTSKTDTKKPSTKRIPETAATVALTSSKSTKTPTVKTSTKSKSSRDSSREPSASRERLKTTSEQPSLPPPPPAPRATAASASADQRLWRSPGEKKCGSSTPIVATSASKSSASAKATRTQPAVSSTTTTSASVKRESAKVSANSSTSGATSASEATLQRMKDIDRQLLDSQQQKMQIDQQIMRLQGEKAAIEAAQMGWHEERSRLLASLMSGCSSGKANPPPPSSSRSSSSKKRSGKSTPPPVPVSASTPSAAIKPKSSDAKPDKPAKSKTETGSKRKRKPEEPPESDEESPIKIRRRKAKRPIDLTESDIDEDSQNTPAKSATLPSIERPRPADHDCLLLDEQQMNSYLHNQCRVRLTRLTVESLAAIDAPTFTVPTAAIGSPAVSRQTTAAPIAQSPATEEDTVSSLSDDSGSLDERFDGYFTGHRLVIVYVHIVGKYLLAASEDGNVYKYVWRTGRLAATFAHHTQTVTALTETGRGMLMSISLDGFVRQFHMKKFDKQIEAHNVDEPLQATAYSWNTVFVGSKSGKIYVLSRNEELNRFRLTTEPLCTESKAVMSLVPSRDGARNILIVGSRSSDVTVRDSQSGLLLRTICTPDKTTVYSLLLDDGVLYCGTNHNQMLAFDFANGQLVYGKTLALGTICIRPFGARVLLCGCYDGNIYAIDKRTGADICSISGSGKMLLNFVLVKNKIIAATKNSRSMQVCKLPDAVLQYSDGGPVEDNVAATNPEV